MTIYCKTTIIHEVETLAGTTIQSFASYTFLRNDGTHAKKSCRIKVAFFQFVFINCYILTMSALYRILTKKEYILLYIRIRKDPPPQKKNPF